MALSPWPTSPVALATATTTLKQVLPATLTDERVQQLGSTSSAVIEDFAPGAPQNVKDQCVEMYAGYLAEARQSPLVEISAGTLDLKYAENRANHSGAFRLCGAAGLLTRWKIRRAGAI